MTKLEYRTETYDEDDEEALCAIGKQGWLLASVTERWAQRRREKDGTYTDFYVRRFYFVRGLKKR